MKPVEDGELEELASHCIRCGFCLEACPTFRLTGRETDSPRGRIYLARSAEEGKISWQEATESLDRCLGCRACEPACPSGVEYGRILELARNRIETAKPRTARSALLSLLSNPGRLRRQLSLARLLPGKRLPWVLSALLSGSSAEADRPTAQEPVDWPPIDEPKLPAIRGEVFLLEGCAMRVLFPNVHEATRRLLRRVGYRVTPSDAGCCGALHAHNGQLDEAHSLALSLLAAMPGEFPIIVNSAGCGAWLKDAPGATRVADVSEFLLAEGLEGHLRAVRPMQTKATYHDACHLAHGQGVRDQPRRLLNAIPGLIWVDLPEADTCCGSAGIYNLAEPKLARQLLDRKWANVEATGAELLVMGNPGCHSWLQQAAREHGGRVSVLHTAELLEFALSGLSAKGN